MQTFLIILHVVVSFSLIFVVLVQGGKGAEMGAAFGGGGSNTVFGGRGAATMLSKMTTIIAVLFMVTSLLLTMVSVKGGSSVVKGSSAPVSQQAPAQAVPTTAPDQAQIPASSQLPPGSSPAGLAPATVPAAPAQPETK